jgi:hypothetical protein
LEIMWTINTTKDIPVVDNQVCKEVITSDTIQKVVQPIKVHDNIQTECVKPNTQVSDLPKRGRRFFSKIVIKTTDGYQDTSCSFGFATFHFYICPCQSYFHFAVLFLWCPWKFYILFYNSVH